MKKFYVEMSGYFKYADTIEAENSDQAKEIAVSYVNESCVDCDINDIDSYEINE